MSVTNCITLRLCQTLGQTLPLLHLWSLMTCLVLALSAELLAGFCIHPCSCFCKPQVTFLHCQQLQSFPRKTLCSGFEPQPWCCCLSAHLLPAVELLSIPLPPQSQAGMLHLTCCKPFYFCWLGKSCWSWFLFQYFTWKRGNEAALQSLTSSGQQLPTLCLLAPGAGGWFGKVLPHLPPCRSSS